MKRQEPTLGDEGAGVILIVWEGGFSCRVAVAESHHGDCTPLVEQPGDCSQPPSLPDDPIPGQDRNKKAAIMPSMPAEAVPTGPSVQVLDTTMN